MRDIVERLRGCQGVLTHDPECNCAEAAAEIERLRTENEQLRMQMHANTGQMAARRALEHKP